MTLMQRTSKRNHGLSRFGFTLIEMIAATVVMGILLTALVGISRASMRQAKRARKLSERFPSTSILSEQIARDIRNADGYSTTDTGFLLFGAITTEPNTGRGTHQLARVAYSVQRLRGLRVLTRVEIATNGQRHQRIVWIGAGSASLQSAGVLSGQTIDVRLTGGLSPMPTIADVQILSEDGEPILIKRIRHHREVR